MSRASILALALSLSACGAEPDPAPAPEAAPVAAREAAPAPRVTVPDPAPAAAAEAAPSAEPAPPSPRRAPRRVAARAPEREARPAPEPSAPRPPAPPPAAAAADDGVTLTRVVVAPAIASREPVRAPLHAATERAFLFVEARNAGDAPVTLEVSFTAPDGTAGAPITLEVPPAPRWRTWATTRRVQGRPGAWTAHVRVGGREIARQAFDVRPAPTPES